MNTGNYIGLLIVAAPFFILVTIGYWKLFQKAGKRGWKALIPVYSSYIMLKISGRPGWWVVLLFVPVVSWVVGVGIVVDFIKCFGKCYLRNRIAAVLLPFIFLPKWGFDSNTQYLGPSASKAFRDQYPYSIRPINPIQWAQALFFAVFTAIFIRAFFIEIYVIPTPSMERTLLVGDNVVVSKLSYGARLPITPIAFPFANSTLPYGGLKAYWDGLHFPYLRLPGFGDVERNDIVVFNYPEDTIDNRPVDKREIFIKRSVGVAGDTISLVNADVYVNGKKSQGPPDEELTYRVKMIKGGINPEVYRQLHVTLDSDTGLLTMTRQSAAVLGKYADIASVTRVITSKTSFNVEMSIFPYELGKPRLYTNGLPVYRWNLDNMGPVVIPKKGWTVKLDSATYPLYARAISVYEHNTVAVTYKGLFINGKKTDRYTFKMNYYWVMGDNRYDSADSRYWGFVPEDHIIGKALFTWMSWDANAPLFEKFRWDRFLKAIN